VLAVANETGVIGNGFLPGQINSIINWNQQFGLTVGNTTETAGGSDKETDEQYRYRIWLAIESYSTCGPRAAYEFWALSAHPDIVQCVVHSAPEIAGEVHLYPLMRGGQLPTSDILDLVLATCSADTRRPVTDYVFAHAPVVFNYTVNITYYVLSINEVVLSAIDKGVRQAVDDWILWQRSYVGRDINADELIKRCVQAGAKRIEITQPSPMFQVLAYNQLAVCDTTAPPGDQTFTDGAKAGGTPALTSASADFSSSDVGLPVSGTGIATGSTILSVVSPTQVTLSLSLSAGAATGLTFTIHTRVSPLVINFGGFEDQ
jgi:hypothetical protein